MRTVKWALIGSILLTATIPAFAQRGRPQRDRDDDEREEPKRIARLHDEAPALDATFAESEGRIELDNYRGRIILLFYFRTNDPASVEMMSRMNDIQSRYANDGVVIIGLTPQAQGDAESVVREQGLKFIVGYSADASESYPVPSFPYVYMLDTEGVLVDRFDPTGRLEHKVEMQMVMTPPAAADTSALQRRYTRAQEAYREREYGRAWTLAKEVSRVVDNDSSLGKIIGKLVDDLEEASERWLEEAKQASRREQYEQAARILAELSVRFRDTEIAEEAESEIGRLMGIRNAKQLMKQALQNSRGQQFNDKAADREATNDYLGALGLYRAAVKEYPDTAAAAAAAEAIERIRSDEQAQEMIAKRRAAREAERWLDIGDRFRRAEMLAQARQYYQRTLEKHPNTRAGTEARQRIEQLPEPEPDEVADRNEPASTQ